MGAFIRLVGASWTFLSCVVAGDYVLLSFSTQNMSVIIRLNVYDLPIRPRQFYLQKTARNGDNESVDETTSAQKSMRPEND